MYNAGFRSKNKTPDGVGTVAAQASFVQQSDPTPTITSWSIQGLDDRALNPAGGQTVVVKGGGFTSGMTVTVGTTSIGSVTIVDSTQATFTSPAKSAGNYTLTMANANGQAAILVPGLAYSTIVTWSTSAGNIGTTLETTAFTESVVATSDSSITYTLASGSLPTNATLNANGTITGTAASTASPTTYSFSITATDAELQDSTQSFTITVNPDTVTWSSPANNTTYSVLANQAISNVPLSATSAAGSGITYTANALPTGVSLTGNVIYGTPTTAQSVSTLLTATANTTTRTATEVINWSVTLGDLYWPYVTVLLNGDTGTNVVNGAQNNTFLDSSPNNVAVTRAGSATQGSFTPYSQTGWSNYFDGSGDYLSVADNDALDGFTGDFTVEYWVYFTSVTSGVPLSKGWDSGTNFSAYLWQLSGSNLLFYASSTGSSWNLASGVTALATPTANTWYHIAISRSGTAVKLFANGTVTYSFSSSATFLNSTSALTIGSAGAGYSPMTGYVSNVRVVKGTAIYTAAFTPPTSPLTAVSNTSLLTCQSNRFIDNSTNAFAVTPAGNTTVMAYSPFSPANSYAPSTNGGSMYCVDTSAYCYYSASGAQVFGTGDFTVECWLYATAASHNISISGTTTNTWGLITYLNNVYWQFNGGNAQSGGTVPLNAWSHIAIVRISGVTKGYLNGVQIFSAADTNNYSGAPSRGIGPTAGGTGGQYISDFRVLVGTGLYTTAFTPPTSPLTSIANTGILTSFTNGGIVDAHASNDAETVGNAQLSTAITKFGTASLAFDGTGDYLKFASGPNPNFALGSRDWTIEMWMYPTSSAATQLFFDIYDGNSSGRLTLQLNTARTIGLYGASGAARTVSTGTVTLNTWQHIAFCKASGSTRIFINGTQVNTTYADSVNYTCTTGVIYLAANGTNGGNNFFGYIDDFRITKGIARYTANFTAPTSAFPTQ